MAAHNKQSEVAGQQADNRLIDHYQSQSISSGRLHVMLEESQALRRRRMIGIAVAASVLFLSLVVFTHQHSLVSQRTNLVMREAALNHSSEQVMDAESGSLKVLQGELGDLPFEIKMPESHFFSKLAILGGRYCTINGYLAAHLRLTDPQTSKRYSLFLTPSKDGLLAMKNENAVLSGVDVKLWQEDGVVYAFAENSGDIL